MTGSNEFRGVIFYRDSHYLPEKNDSPSHNLPVNNDGGVIILGESLFTVTPVSVRNGIFKFPYVPYLMIKHLKRNMKTFVLM